MVKDGAVGGVALAHVAVAEGTDEYVIDGKNEHFPKGLIGAIVLVGDSGGNVMGVAKVGDLGG